MSKSNQKLDQRDEQILAAILAGAAYCKREVRPHNSHDGVQGSNNYFGMTNNGPCCAVGVGLLYAGIKGIIRPVVAFSKHYGVDIEYAQAVSYGFESRINYKIEPCSDNYRRGYAVGQIAFKVLCQKP